VKNGIETCFGGVLIPIVLVRRPQAGGAEAAQAAQQEDLMATLTDTERTIAASIGVSPSEFARAKARRAQGQETYGLTPEQLKIAAGFGMSPRAFASQLARNGGSRAIAAAAGYEGQPGLAGAHREVDFAHEHDYDAHGSGTSPGDRELLDAAMSALKGYKPDKDDDDNYDRLLMGVVYAMRLLNRVAPPYVESRTAKK
jgi:hypothetical protein